MGDDEEYLLDPVAEKMCSYESLLDGTIGMEDLARMNDYLAVKAENTYRANRARAREAENRRGR